MNRKAFIAMLPMAILAGCISTSPKSETASADPGEAISTSAPQDTARAERKISFAIGRENGDFKVLRQEDGEAPMGYHETVYAVQTRDGKTYKCSIIEPSGFGRVMTFGMGSGSGAMCTDFTKGSKQQGMTNAASCNQLLRAAGKC